MRGGTTTRFVVAVAAVSLLAACGDDTTRTDVGAGAPQTSGAPALHVSLAVDTAIVDAGAITGAEQRTADLASAETLSARPLSPMGLPPIVRLDRRTVFLAEAARDTFGGYPLRVADGTTERVLVPEAFAFALRQDGRVAVAVPDASPAAGRQLTKIVVGTLEGSLTDVWTTAPDQYLPVAWAGDRLLALRSHGDAAPGDLLVFDRAGSVRVLAARGGYFGVSPDGSRIVAQPVDGAGPVVMDVATGTVVGRLVAPEWIEVIQGQWTRDGYVATATTSRGSALVVARPDGDDLRAEVLAVYESARIPSLTDPTFDGVHATAIGLNGPVPRRDGSIPAQPYLLVACGLATKTCTTTPIATPNGVVVIRTA